MTTDQRKRADIAEFTHRGDENRSNNDFTNAIENYKKAYNLSREINDDKIERLCALNLGAACICADKAEEGLSYLHKAEPPDNVRDEPSNGALFFNKGLGYKKLGNSKNALENFKSAYEEYKEYERYDTDVLLHCLEFFLTTYRKQGDHLKAADVCKELAHLFDGLSKVRKLCERVNHLRLGESFEDSKKEAHGLLETVVKMDLEGNECLEAANILNDIGLASTLVHSYDDAKVSFEKALERLQDSHIPELLLEAVFRQNLGASYNFLGEYGRAVHFHEEAINRYGKTNNRNSQGKCFTNLAYALTQQGDLKQAEVAFHHALRAAKDSEDTHMEWQALEGLGAVNFSQGDYKSAVDFFLEALKTVKDSQPESERIKKKSLQAHQKLLGVRSNEPKLTERSLRDLQIHPVLFEEHAHVGATPRENYKSLTAEIFTSEPPMTVKVEDPPPENMVVTEEDQKMMAQLSQDKLEKCLTTYEKQGDHLKAADVCKELAHLFDGLSKVRKLCERVNHLRLGESFEDSKKEAHGLLETVVKMDLEGNECLEAAKILNEIGLASTLVHSYDDAKVSFEKALERLQDSHIPELQLEAVFRQNLGASYNFLGEYGRAVHFHEEAINRYGKTNNRNSQGKCFTNLAYALTQQGDLKQAAVAFHHALRAAKDSEDTHMEWQALEGLGAVNFSQGDYKSAVDFYLEALKTVKDSQPASERIKKKSLEAHQKLLGVRSNEPKLTERSLRDLQIHPVLFEEHAHVGATPRENYKSLTAEIFTSEPPMTVKVEDPPPENMVVTVEDKQEKISTFTQEGFYWSVTVRA